MNLSAIQSAKKETQLGNNFRYKQNGSSLSLTHLKIIQLHHIYLFLLWFMVANNLSYKLSKSISPTWVPGLVYFIVEHT